MNLRIAMVVTLSLATGGLFAESRDDLVRLLNSRSAQSPRVYAEAAKSVREAADAGGLLQRFVIAIVSQDVDAPPAAKLSAHTRREWLAETRERIARLAERKDNSLAWYLLALDTGNVSHLERAAEGGNVQALNAYGTILTTRATEIAVTNAPLAKTVLAKAFDCFRLAAGKKDENGIYNLGMCYMQGIGCEPDPDKAVSCFKTAAEAGQPEAINNIGGCFRDGIVVMTNAQTAVRWFRKSAELGNAFGQLNYALALQRGDGCARDEKKAAELLRLAAEADNAEAMDVYAMCLFSGRGTERNLEGAFRYFRRSAEAGFPPAMDNLASCYGQGLGTPRDVLKSALWKMRARAARGDRDARAWLEREAKGSVEAMEKAE